MQARCMLSSCVCLSVRLFVCVCVTSRYWLDESSWVLACRSSSTCYILFYKEIRAFAKIMVLSSGTLSQTLNFEWEIFATASRSCCQQNSSTAEFVGYTYDGRRFVAGCMLFITRPSQRNALTPFCCGFLNNWFLSPCGRLNWLMSAFERTLK